MSRLKQGGFLISKIHQLAGRIFAKKLKDYAIEINPSQGRILFVLWQNDAISIRELAHKTALEKSTLTSMLDRLEEMGYVKRLPSTEDRRKILIKLTPKNQELQQLHQAVSVEMNELFYQGFTEEEIWQFEKSLSRIFANLNCFETQER
ncbi:MAG TPA: MarR family transcriptional regulator [Bacillota bacterium]|nr:MarR family transcriptional regulator [Bacillota bacterium]